MAFSLGYSKLYYKRAQLSIVANQLQAMDMDMVIIQHIAQGNDQATTLQYLRVNIYQEVPRAPQESKGDSLRVLEQVSHACQSCISAHETICPEFRDLLAAPPQPYTGKYSLANFCCHFNLNSFALLVHSFIHGTEINENNLKFVTLKVCKWLLCFI